MSYKVKRSLREFPTDCKWSKPEWKETEVAKIGHDNGWEMSFRPSAEVKLRYDDHCLHLIYRVNDNYVRCVTSQTNGEVWKDSCVEFFFAPEQDKPGSYFNLEMNCGGHILMRHQDPPNGRSTLAESDIAEIKVCHSMPPLVVNEIAAPTNWTLEVALPFEMLRGYCNLKLPSNGTRWRANFYKCAENNSHPHWLSWSPIIAPEPNFHLPEFFGEIEFE